MNLEEVIEKAFEAGVKFMTENSYAEGPEDDLYVQFPTKKEIEMAFTEYINGNLKSSKSTSILHESHGGSI